MGRTRTHARAWTPRTWWASAAGTVTGCSRPTPTGSSSRWTSAAPARACSSRPSTASTSRSGAAPSSVRLRSGGMLECVELTDGPAAAVLDPDSAAGQEVRRERRRARKEEKRLEEEREEKIRRWKEKQARMLEEERQRLLAREEEISNMTPLERVDGLGSLDDDTARMLEKRKLRLQRRQAPTTGRVNKAAYRRRMEEAAGGKTDNVQPLQTRTVEQRSKVRVELPPPGQCTCLTLAARGALVSLTLDCGYAWRDSHHRGGRTPPAPLGVFRQRLPLGRRVGALVHFLALVRPLGLRASQERPQIQLGRRASPSAAALSVHASPLDGVHFLAVRPSATAVPSAALSAGKLRRRRVQR